MKTKFNERDNDSSLTGRASSSRGASHPTASSPRRPDSVEMYDQDNMFVSENELNRLSLREEGDAKDDDLYAAAPPLPPRSNEKPVVNTLPLKRTPAPSNLLSSPPRSNDSGGQPIPSSSEGPSQSPVPRERVSDQIPASDSTGPANQSPLGPNKDFCAFQRVSWWYVFKVY